VGPVVACAVGATALETCHPHNTTLFFVRVESLRKTAEAYVVVPDIGTRVQILMAYAMLIPHSETSENRKASLFQDNKSLSLLH